MKCEGDVKEGCCDVSHRHMVVAMCTGGLMVGLGAWSTFSLVLTHLTAHLNTTTSSPFTGPLSFDCPENNGSEDSNLDTGEDTVLLMHTTYTAAITTFKLAGGVLATRFSPTRVIGVSMAMLCTILLTLPAVLRSNVQWLLFLLIFLQGTAYSLLVPVFVKVTSSWTTEKERSSRLAIVYSGMYLGTAVCVVLTGACVCYIHWSSAIFITGGTGFLWTGVWLLRFYDNPQVHPNLSAREKLHFSAQEPSTASSKRLFHSIPWRAIVRSGPVWSMFLAVFARDYMLVVLTVLMPQYYSDVYTMNPVYVGLCSILPPLGTGLMVLMGGVFSDLLLKRGLHKTFVRKLLVCSGGTIQGLSFLGLSFTGSWTLAVALFSVASLGGIATAGYPPMFHDMSPKYTSVLAGIAQYGFVGAVVASVLAAFLPGKSKSLVTWQTFFLITGLTQLLIALAFLIMADSTRQPWADGDVTDTSSSRHAEGRARMTSAWNDSVVTSGEEGVGVKAGGTGGDRMGGGVLCREDVALMDQLKARDRVVSDYGSVKSFGVGRL